MGHRSLNKPQLYIGLAVSLLFIETPHFDDSIRPQSQLNNVIDSKTIILKLFTANAFVIANSDGVIG